MAFKKGQSGNPKGRPPGTSRPQLRDFYTPEELAAFVADLKTSAATDPIIKKFVAEHLFGRATQALELSNPDGSLKQIVVIKSDAKRNDRAAA